MDLSPLETATQLLMPTNYDWYTEDEVPQAPDEAPEPPARQPRRWPWVLVALLLLIAVALVVNRQLRQRVTDTENRIEDELAATQTIVERAARDADADILTPFLSGRDLDWTAAYNDLARQGLLNNLTALGIISEPAGTEVAEVRLADDLLSAEVDTLRTYQVSSPLGMTTTVTYRLTNVYRRSSDRWLLAPPEPEFWGAEGMAREGRVRVAFPSRDSELARKIALLVDDGLAEFCSRLESAACPPDLRLAIRLSSDPASLLASADPRTIFESGRRVVLPSPSYFGLPADNASQETLLRGYAAQALSALIADLSDWPCCDHGLFFRALVDAELRSLGLRAWPLKPIQYEALLATELELTAHRANWYNQWLSPDDADDEWPAAYAIVEFALEQGSHEPLELMKQLDGSSFRAWLLKVLGSEPEAPDVNGAWLRFVYERSLSIQAADARPPINQDIHLLCWSNETRPEASLYRYKVSTGEWQVDGVWEGFTFMHPLPGEAGAILQIFGPEDDQTLIWREGRAQEFSPDPSQSSRWSILANEGLSDPQGRYLIALDQVMLLRSEDYLPVLYLVPMQECGAEGSCRSHRLPGYPIWSPDGNHMITMAIDGPLFRDHPVQLSLADGQGNVLRNLGEGRQPGWLNDDAYAYGRSDGTIVAASIDDGELEVVLEKADLLETLPDGMQPRSADLDQIALGPSNSKLATLSAVSDSRSLERTYFFTYDYGQDQLEFILVLENVRAGLLEFTQDGRWLVIRSLESTGSGGSQPWSYTFYNVEDGQLRAVADEPRGPDADIGLSADGNWLLRSFDGFIDLVALPLDVGGGYPYHAVVNHDFVGCREAAWVSPEQ